MAQVFKEAKFALSVSTKPVALLAAVAPVSTHTKNQLYISQFTCC